MHKIPFLAERLQSLQYKQSFDSKAEELKPDVRNVKVSAKKQEVGIEEKKKKKRRRKMGTIHPPLSAILLLGTYTFLLITNQIHTLLDSSQLY